MSDRILAAELCGKGFTSGYAEVRRLINAGAIGEKYKSADKPDSREQLEDDAWKFVERWALDDDDFCRPTTHLNCLKELHELLDRQAAITERKFWECYANGNQWEAHQLEIKCNELTEERDNWANCYDAAVKREQSLLSKIDETTAEVEAQRKRANDAERGVLSEEWYVCRDRYEDDIAELTAERDELDRTANTLRASIAGLSESVKKLKAERDELRERLDAMKAVLDKWVKSTVGIELPDYPITEFQPKDKDRRIAELEAENKRLRDSGACVGCEDVTRQTSELTDERDYWKKQVGKCLDHAVNAYAPAVMEWPRAGAIVEPSVLVADEFEHLRKFNGKCIAENIRLQADMEQKQRVCDVQRDSFLKLERENRELQDVCGELERTIENLRGD